MAWTIPIIWVTAGMANATAGSALDLNAQIRDNFLELGTHGHKGGSGSGAATVGNVIHVTYIDAAAPAAPGGTLTYLASSATALIFRSGAAGAVRVIANTTHTHGGF